MAKARVYIDACIWIASYSPDEEFTPEQRAGFQSLADGVNSGEWIVFGSHLLYAQLLTMSAERLETAYDGRKGIFAPLDDVIAKKVRDLQHEGYRVLNRVLSTEDAVHLVTASNYGCKFFVTKDWRHKEKQLSPLKDKEFLEKALKIQIVDPSHFLPKPEQPVIAKFEDEPLEITYEHPTNEV